MNNEDNFLAGIIFENRILKYNGQEFENFFIEVMTNFNSNFKPVQAWGRIGDKKNDGFDETTGTYYQVFSPEDITKKATINEAVKKLEIDFKKLYKYWDDKCTIKKFYFVINDKFKGCPTPIYNKIFELQKSKDYKKISLFVFLAKDLKKIFNSLDEENKISIIGLIPTEISSVCEYEALNKTIEYLLNLEIDDNHEDDLKVPNFNDKIKFNKLNNVIETKLTMGSYQEGLLIKYFDEFPGVKEILRKKFSTIYKKSKEAIKEDVNNFSNNRFIYILNEACCKNNIQIQTSVYILMAHYFESCDIFEKPPKKCKAIQGTLF